MDIDPCENVNSEKTGNASIRGAGGVGVVGGARKAPSNAYEEVKRFKEGLKNEELPPRAQKKMLADAVQLIENLLKLKVPPPATPQRGHKGENSAIAEILQEIKVIKDTITQNQGLSRTQG
ncbi:hypothetical protein K3495_g12305 [Podosphaera aphanis]|nr:hypothetical protein K3495_g12305 [Podosphaera aphanis]